MVMITCIAMIEILHDVVKPDPFNLSNKPSQHREVAHNKRVDEWERMLNEAREDVYLPSVEEHIDPTRVHQLSRLVFSFPEKFTVNREPMTRADDIEKRFTRVFEALDTAQLSDAYKRKASTVFTVYFAIERFLWVTEIKNGTQDTIRLIQSETEQISDWLGKAHMLLLSITGTATINNEQLIDELFPSVTTTIRVAKENDVFLPYNMDSFPNTLAQYGNEQVTNYL